MHIDWWSEQREEQWMKHGPQRAHEPIYGVFFRKHGYDLFGRVAADRHNDKHAKDTFTVREGWQ